jgi:hypothetical protein
MPFDNPPQAPIGDVAILMDARSRIADPSRWLQYSFQDGDRHCLVAALSLACGSPSFDIPNETERRLAKHLAKQMVTGAKPRAVLLRRSVRGGGQCLANRERLADPEC